MEIAWRWRPAVAAPTTGLDALVWAIVSGRRAAGGVGLALDAATQALEASVGDERGQRAIRQVGIARGGVGEGIRKVGRHRR